MFGISQQLLMWMFGAAFIAAGLAARLGRWKNWYWTTRGAVYGYTPLGLLFIVYSFNGEAQTWPSPYSQLYQVAVVLLIAVGVWWSLRPPAVVKPAWVRWVEVHPQSVWEAMAGAVKDGGEWEFHVASPEAVNAWAKALARKKRSARAKP